MRRFSKNGRDTADVGQHLIMQKGEYRICGNLIRSIGRISEKLGKSNFRKPKIEISPTNSQ